MNRRRGWITHRASLFTLLATLLAGAGAVGAVLFKSQPTSPPDGRTTPIGRRYTGINLATGSFAGNKIPGIFGRDYAYPTDREAAPFLAAGMTAVRVPFRWERVQPIPGAPLDPIEMERLDKAIAALAGFGLIILDPHNYGGYRGVKLGQPDRPPAMLAHLWTRLAARYRTNPRIAFGLMNEPIGMSPETWRDIAQETIGAIRATGARNLVLVPGTRWTGAHSWMKGGNRSNGAVLAGFTDPGKNMAFEFHQYVDDDSSGTKSTCVSPERAAARLAPATAWLRLHRARGFLAEFGAPRSAECLAALGAMLGALDSADDVWMGWTYWAGGSMWGDYPMSVQPGPKGPKPQMQVLVSHLARDGR